MTLQPFSRTLMRQLVEQFGNPFAGQIGQWPDEQLSALHLFMTETTAEHPDLVARILEETILASIEHINPLRQGGRAGVKFAFLTSTEARDMMLGSLIAFVESEWCRRHPAAS